MLHLLLSIVWCLIAFVKHLKHTQYREIVCFVFRYMCIYLKKNLFFGLLSFYQWLQVTSVFVCQPICGCYCPCNMLFRLVTQLYMVVWVTVQKWGNPGGTKKKEKQAFYLIRHKPKALCSCFLFAKFLPPLKRWLHLAQKEDMQDIFSNWTPPLLLHAQLVHNAPPPWLSVLFLLEEREKEQGYTGRHINGACHARWSS